MRCFFFFLQVEALSSLRVVQVACGSRDAQTLALTACGKVFSWGDGDFGKLGKLRSKTYLSLENLRLKVLQQYANQVPRFQVVAGLMVAPYP